MPVALKVNGANKQGQTRSSPMRSLPFYRSDRQTTKNFWQKEIDRRPFGALFKIRETVVRDTPASLATSRLVARFLDMRTIPLFRLTIDSHNCCAITKD